MSLKTGKLYGDIVDFECDLEDGLLLSKLFLKASLYLKNLDAETITTWALPHTYLYNIFKSIGFTETNQGRYFCVKVLKPSYEYLYDFSHWQFVQADTEIY